MNIVNNIKKDDQAFWQTCRIAISGSAEELRQQLSEEPHHLHQKTIGIKEGLFQVSLLHLVGSAENAHLLAELGLTIDETDEQGNTPLHFAALAGRKEVVTALLSLGAAHLENRWGQKPLQLAITPEIAHLLREENAPLPLDPSLQSLSIVEAAKQGKIDVIRYLLQTGVDPNLLNHPDYMLDYHENTPLRQAVYVGYVEIVRLLLEHGANPNVHPNLYRDVYNVGTARLLHSYGTQVTPEGLDEAVWEAAINVGNSELVQEYISYGAPLTKEYILHDTIKRPEQTNDHHLKIAEMLVKKNPKQLHHFKGNETPLQKAIDIGNQAMVDCLIQLGADINLKNEDGLTPLHIAVLNNNAILLEFLLNHGADPKQEDQFGLTPYQYAVMKLRTKLYHVFQRYGEQNITAIQPPLTVDQAKQTLADQQDDLINLYHTDDLESWVFFRFKLKDFVAFAKRFGFSTIFQTRYFLDEAETKYITFDEQGMLEKDLSFAQEFSIEHTLAFHPAQPQWILSMIHAWDADTDYDWTQLHIRCSAEMGEEIVTFYRQYWNQQHETYDYYSATGGDIFISFPNKTASKELNSLIQYINQCQLRGLEQIWASDFFKQKNR
ncbi:ankyrin repeat domain-containing protein [Desmospora activa]|uniref:Ankyrin repeat protein n=1 Tax=Desmospora activa DSM 45169 TaxID=1121389 RepID=A0A2T4Z7J0_9BACL|nr:ankyrin repeat domain-containing protein [Desmospora activa]PTM57854.1 ankyrin repeat protein [Desmospora activa DSM 45169]